MKLTCRGHGQHMVCPAAAIANSGRTEQQSLHQEKRRTRHPGLGSRNDKWRLCRMELAEAEWWDTSWINACANSLPSSADSQTRTCCDQKPREAQLPASAQPAFPFSVFHDFPQQPWDGRPAAAKKSPAHTCGLPRDWGTPRIQPRVVATLLQS